MLGREDIKNVLGIEPAISPEMLVAIDEWQNMLFGRASWVDNQKVWSLRLEQSICREFANVVMTEMVASVTDKTIDTVFQTCIRGLHEHLQKWLALGEGIIKPLGEDTLEYVDAGNYMPVQYDDRGRLTHVVFFATRKVGTHTWYRRFEYHELVGETLTITNRAFVSNSVNAVGKEINITDVAEWANIEPKTTYNNVKRPIFAFYKNPFMNTIDGSYSGQSAYESAKYIIQAADEQFGHLRHEFKSGQRATYVSADAVRKTNLADGTEIKLIDTLGDRTYEVLDTEDTNFYKEFSPAFRDINIINGLEEYKRDIEFAVGLAYGDLSKASDVEKTATEVKAGKQRKYNTVEQIEKNVRQTLEDLAYAIAFWNALTLSGYEVTTTFNDSILTDEKEERLQSQTDISIGAMQVLEYRMKYYNEDKATAMTKIISEQDFGTDTPDGMDQADASATDVTATDVSQATEQATGKTLNGAQTQSLIAIIAQYTSGSLTLGQAVNMISIAIGITREEAEKLINGTV